MPENNTPVLALDDMSLLSISNRSNSSKRARAKKEKPRRASSLSDLTDDNSDGGSVDVDETPRAPSLEHQDPEQELADSTTESESERPLAERIGNKKSPEKASPDSDAAVTKNTRCKRKGKGRGRKKVPKRTRKANRIDVGLIAAEETEDEEKTDTVTDSETVAKEPKEGDNAVKKVTFSSSTKKEAVGEGDDGDCDEDSDVEPTPKKRGRRKRKKETKKKNAANRMGKKKKNQKEENDDSEEEEETEKKNQKKNEKEKKAKVQRKRRNPWMNEEDTLGKPLPKV